MFVSSSTMRLKSSASSMLAALVAHTAPTLLLMGRARPACAIMSMARRTSLRISCMVKPESKPLFKMRLG
ncbi:hypothetical protein D3C87_2166830 [compost metagenome]